MKTEKDEFQGLLADLRQSQEYALEDLVQTFADELWTAMETRGMNQAEMARNVGINRQFLTTVFKGKPNLTIKTMAKLAGALGHRLCLHLAPKEFDCQWFHFGKVEVQAVTHENKEGPFGKPVSYHEDFDNRPTHHENLRLAA